ncbi:helix-turn-helix transcriptional regulator [Pusillimonas sp.]|uniref:helix-turn-helix domain-containing protein n=1 Tax=Pusillimonas sp. TaxID=3040095 RepID=UPI0029ADD83A|nr:helix-turn-helix transcriptional regulator [Pusillimonas sp.]MDX3896053.1 helix-turn-helix transcriptional regulator [Pusillimonas sp.]
MNKPLLRAVSSTPEPIAEPDEARGLGASLRAMRMARGCSLSDVSARLKYSVRQLDALENEQWDRLPNGVLLRGLVKNYGRFLETDVDALLAMLDTQVGTRSAASVSVPVPAASLSGADLPLHPEGGSRSWGWLLIIVVLLVVAGVYAIDRGWVPDSWLIFDWLKALKQ